MRIRQPIVTVLGHVDHGKCVARNTLVFLASGETKQIETIFESNFDNGKKIVCDDGICIELEKPIEVLGEESGAIKPMIISHLWKLEKKDLVRVECENGFSIEATPEHPFPVINGDFGISYVPSSALKESDYILVPGITPVAVNSLDAVKSALLEKLAEKNFLGFLEEGFCSQLKQVAQIRASPPVYCEYRCRRFRIPHLIELCKNHFSYTCIFDKVLQVKQSSTKWRAGHTSKRVMLPKTKAEIEGLFYFAGLFVGDGDNKTGKLCNNDAELLTAYKQYCESVFGIECLIQKGHTCLEAAPKGGKTLTSFLQAVFEIPTGKKSAYIKVPKIVQVAPDELAAKFVRGYFDTDGYVDLNNGIEVSSNSREMLKGLAHLLLRFGIRCFVRKNKQAYRLTIKGKTNVNNFAALIGFELPSKKNLLEKYLKIAGTSRVLEASPIDGTQLKALRKEFGVGNKRLKIPFLEKTENYKAVSMNFVKRFSDRLALIAKEHCLETRLESANRLKNLAMLANGNLSFSKIIKREFIRNDYGFVFDLTQPKTHNFVAEGFLIHNTCLLDKIRGTAIAEKEAGAITQHIGATQMPIELIKKIAGRLMQQYGFDVHFPGLLFIDTPGHAAFTSLRERGGSIADLAVLVVDLAQGFQPQTVEAISILKSFKTPFIVAANKLDLLQGWKSREGEFSANVKTQDKAAADRLDEKVYALVGKLHEQGFQSERFDRCTDFKKQVPIVPICAKTGEGMPELLMLLTGLSQRFLEKRLLIEENEAGKGTILEVKEEKGLGKTIDVILYNGVLRVNDRIVLGGREKVIETKVRALLLPKPLQEIRAQGADKFLNAREVHAAAGVKIAAPGLDDALAGSPLLVEEGKGERAAIEKEIASVKRETQAIGPVLKADTLGSLEAMIVLLGNETGLKPKSADVGEVTRRDVMEAAAEKENDAFKAVIFAFNVKIEESGRAEAEKHGVPVFAGKVVYRLIEDYNEWVSEKRDEEKKGKLAKLTLPVKMRFMPGFVFRHSKPAVIGVKVLEGRLRPGIRVLNHKGILVGRLSGIQVQGKSIEQATKGQEVAASIDKGIVGRNLEENKVLYSYIPSAQFSELAQMGDYFNPDEKELIEEIHELEKKTLNEKEAD